MNRHAKGFIGVVIGVSCSVQAVTRTWLSSTGGVWTSPANWSDSTIPGADDTADLSAATGAVDVAENIAVGAILYNPAFSGTTNTLTLLSDTAAPGSRSISLTTTAPSQIQVGEGAQLLIDADLTPSVDVVKDGRGSLVIKRRLASAYEVSLAVVQGSVVNEGSIEYPVTDTLVGTLASDTGPAAAFVMRAGSTYVGGNATDVIFGNASGARAVIAHEGGTINLTQTSSSEPFLNGFVAGSESVYTISGGELNLSNKRLNVAYFGSGTVNQSGGKVRANQIYVTPNESSGSAVGSTISRAANCGWVLSPVVMTRAGHPRSTWAAAASTRSTPATRSGASEASRCRGSTARRASAPTSRRHTRVVSTTSLARAV